ncbi:hypothetical protein ABIF27_003850 [Bradyrhizobium elkanii]
MPDNIRDLPAGRSDGLYRFLGGSPLSVAFRLILLSILVGVVLAAIGLDPWNILTSIRRLFQSIWDFGFDAINWAWRYFLLGAVIVIPIWLLSRLFGAPRGPLIPGRVRSRCNCDLSAAAMHSAPAAASTPVSTSAARAAIF